MSDYEIGALLVLVGAALFVASPIAGVALARVWMWVDVTRTLRRAHTFLQARMGTRGKDKRPDYRIE